MSGFSAHPPSWPAGYLDAADHQPMHPAALQALAAATEAAFADPMRLYGAARNARLVAENAVAAVAQCLAVRPDEISFTGSLAAAHHAGFLGLAEGLRRNLAQPQESPTPRLVLSAIEHSAVSAAAHWWSRTHGWGIETVAVDHFGCLDLDALANLAAAPGPAVYAIQQANLEIGTVQDLEAIRRTIADAPLFVDASAAAALSGPPAQADAYSLGSGAFGGPSGPGLAVVRRGRARWRHPFPSETRLDPRGVPGEQIPTWLAVASALNERVTRRETLGSQWREATSRLRTALSSLQDVEVHGHADLRLPHIVSFSVLYVDGEALVSALDARGFSVASGSACASDAATPSHVLSAIGALTHGNARISLGWGSDVTDLDRLMAVLPEVIAQLRGHLPAGL